MLGHIREHDPAGHLRTTNVWQHWSAHTWPVLKADGLDFYASHLFYPNLPFYLRQHYDLVKEKSGLIMFTTEADASPFPRGADVTLRYMRVTLWSSHMMPHPGAACPWWWVLIDQKDAYGQFAALARFAEGEDRRGKNYVSRDASVRDTSEADRRQRKLRIECLGNEKRAFCWVYNSVAFSQQSHWSAPPAGGATVTVPGLEDARYTVEVWDTLEGKVLTSIDAESKDQKLEFELPEFTTDVACKVIQQSKARRRPRRPQQNRDDSTDHALPD
jgi:hypothetical protein